MSSAILAGELSSPSSSSGSPPDRAFTVYWWAATTSSLGDGLRLTALPLLVVSLSRSSRDVALVAAAGTLPWLVLGLPVGVLADRVPVVTTMKLVQAVRTAVIVLVVVLLTLSGVTIHTLAVAALALGACEVCFDVLTHTATPAVVDSSRLHAANSRLLAGEAATLQIGGPILAGALFAASETLVFAVTAGAFLVSSVLLSALAPRVRRRETPRAGGQGGRAAGWRADFVEGLRVFFRTPGIGAVSAMCVVLNLAAGGFLGVQALFAREQLGLGAVGYGVLVALGSIGVLGAALGGELLSTAARRRVVLLATGPVITACFWAIAAFPTPGVTAAALVVWGGLATMFSIVTLSWRQSVAPEHVLGRLTSIHRFLCWGALPVGAWTAGVVADSAGLGAVPAACALVVGLGTVTLLPAMARVPASLRPHAAAVRA
jgi:hypothetical protein